MTAKQYGLILPSKTKNSENYGTRALNPLLDSDDELERESDEAEPALNWVEASLKTSAGNSGQKSLQKRMLKEALEQDPTVFQYDEVFDDMKASQQKQKEKKGSVGKKTKYIDTIIKHCEKRKLESERRLERKVQKEREAEGDEFADKESFVTPSYLKKLEELKEAEEAEKKEKILEEMNDVHKHKNFGVFYNHLFKQRVGDLEIKQEPPDDDVSERENEIKTDSTFLRNRTDQRKNIRARMREEESPERSNINIKREPGVSDKELEEDTGSKNDSKRKPGFRHASSDESRSPEREKLRDRPRGETSRGHRDDSGDRRRRDSAMREKRKDGSSSKDRGVPKSQNRRYRSRSRSPKDRSQTTHRKDKERGLGRRSESPSKGKATQRTRRDRSRSDERGRKERAEDGTKREKHPKQIKQEGNERKRRNSSTRDEENKNESASNKSKKDAAPPQVKQSINTTLGATDINKMKVQDRIKRFLEIFAKRTVGQTYENAVQKYFQRKAERDSGGIL